VKVDLFWKTCAKDYEWLEYSVRSADRFARGFRRCVIVTDEGTENVAMPVPATLDTSTRHLPLPPFLPEYGFSNPTQLYYFWASAVKTMWPSFTDADAVVWIDSDSVFTREITPAWWLMERPGKPWPGAPPWPRWWRVPWTESKDGCAAWKQGVDHLFGVDSQHENMCVCAGLATREATIALHDYIRGKFGQSVAEYYLDPSHGKLGEYTMLGGYLEFVDGCGYVVQHPKTLAEPWPVRQFWSWDPKGPPREEMERILTP